MRRSVCIVPLLRRSDMPPNFTHRAVLFATMIDADRLDQG
jgi:hypothetical protein